MMPEIFIANVAESDNPNIQRKALSEDFSICTLKKLVQRQNFILG